MADDDDKSLRIQQEIINNLYGDIDIQEEECLDRPYHNWITYQGLQESYEYCEICDKKK